MPIPSTIDDLSPVAASNSPAGSDPPTEGDNFLRALSAIIRQEHDANTGTAGTETGAGRFLYDASIVYPDGTVGAKLRESVSVKDFGAVGDGVTDDRTAISNAAEAAEQVILPSGTFIVDCEGGAMDPTRTGRIRFVGSGKDTTTLKFSRTTTTAFSAVNATDREYIFEDMTIDVSLAASCVFIVARMGDAGTVRFRNCRLLGRTTEVAGARSHTSYVVDVSDSASDVAETLEIRDVYANGWSGILLKDNASESRQKLIDVRGLQTEDMYLVDLLINSPAGTVDQVIVDGFSSHNNQGSTVGGVDHRFSCAGVDINSVRLSNFSFTGTGQGMHWEEGAGPGVISNGVIEVQDDEDGIFLTGNNIGGSTVVIDDVQFSNILVRHIGAPTSARGIHVVSEPTTSPRAGKIKFSNVVIENFDDGLVLPGGSTQLSAFIETSNVHIKGCNTGLLANRVHPGLRGITFEDCDVPINANHGGTMGPGIVFADCPVGATATSTNGYVVLQGFTTIRTGVSITGGSANTDIAFCEKPLWSYGNVGCEIAQSSVKAAALLQCEYDGTTLTTSRRADVFSGAVEWSSSAVQDDGTSFLARVVNGGSTITATAVSMAFVGAAAFS